jgi:hypothetical protein
MNNIEKVGNSEWLNMDSIEKVDNSEQLNMNNTEKVDNPEWLDDIKTRNALFRQLGLSENQKYSELSEEEKNFCIG